MLPRELQVGELVQLSPPATRNRSLAACFMVIDESKTWGAVGYVPLPDSKQVWYRATWEEMEPTGGHAQWVETV